MKLSANKMKKEARPTHSNANAPIKGIGLLWLIGPFALLAAAVTLILAIAVNMYLIQPIIDTNNTSAHKVQTELYLRQVNSKLAVYAKQIDGIAATGLTIRAIKNNSMRSEASNQIKATVPGAMRVDFNSNNEAQVDKTSFPPMNFATLDMINRAERGKSIPAEVHKADGKPILRLVRAVKSEQSVIGTVSIAIDFTVFTQDIVTLSDASGSITLSQKVPGAPATDLLSLSFDKSSTRLSPELRPVTDNPNWFLISIAGAGAKANRLDPMLYWATFGGAILLVLLCGILGGLVGQRTLNKDMGLLQEILNLGLLGKPTSFKAKQIKLSGPAGLADNIADFITKIRSAIPTSAAIHLDKTGSKEPLFQNDGALDSAADDLDLDLDLSGVNLADSDSMSVTSISELPADIFRAYDIRGVVGETLTEDTMVWLGKAIGSAVLDSAETTVAVARDGRVSGPALTEALIEGLLATGCNVINIGMVPTPLLYFATNTLSTKSGVILTGSHNPANYNGLKIVIGGKTLWGDDIVQLKKRVETGRICEGEGALQDHKIIDEYMEHVVDDVVLAKPMKVVIDCGNGVAGVIAESLFTEIGCDVVPLFCDIDGNFPNHHPDPSKPSNLKDLIAKVADENADIGIAFDGDGDRIGVVTQQGKIIFPDRLLMLFAKDLLSRNPGADIIFDVKCTRDLTTLISNQGGRAIMWKTGHSLIKAKIKETGAVLAGEMSGHIFFNDRWFGFDDALYSAARLLEILAMDTRSTDEVFAEFPTKVSTPELHIPVADSVKFDLMARIEAEGKFGSGKFTTIDGVRVDYENGWGLVRASNTTPALMTRFEAETESDLQQIQTIFKAELLKINSDLKIPF